MHRVIASSEWKVLIIADSYESLSPIGFSASDYPHIIEHRGDHYHFHNFHYALSLLVTLETDLQSPPDCIFLEWEESHPDKDFFLHQLNSIQVPVVLLVKAEDEGCIVRIAQDYQDYLVKETLTKELIFAALRNAIAQSHLKKEIARKEIARKEIARKEIARKEIAIRQWQESPISKHPDPPLSSEEIIGDREYFYTIADRALVMLRESGTDKSYYYFNQAWLDYTGRSLEQEIGDGWLEGVHPDDREMSRDIYFKAFDARKSFEMEYRLKRHDQVYGWIIDRGAPIFSKDHLFLGYIGFCFDITAHKQTEIELQNNLKFIQKIADASPNILYLYDLQEKRNIYSNREIAKILGYSTEQIQAMKDNLHRNLIHPEDLATMESHLHRLSHARDEEILEVEYRAINANGEIKWLRSYDTIFNRDDCGRVQQIIGNAQDVSDRKQMELNLEESQRFINQIADSSPGIIYLFNVQEQRNIYANKNLQSILGYTPEEIQEMGTDFFPNLIHPEDMDIYFQYFQRIKAAADGEIIQSEYRMKHANGNWRWLYTLDTVFSRDENGKVLLTTGTANDITDRKIVEAELMASEQRFARIVSSFPGIIYTYIHNPEGEHYFEYISSRVEDIYELSPEQVLQDCKCLYDHHHPDDRQGFWDAALHSISSVSPLNHEFRIVTPSGKIKWLQINSMPERIENLNVTLFKRKNGDIARHGIMLDITELKLAEARLLEQTSQQKLLSIITQRIRSSLQLEEILNITVTEIHKFFHGDRTLIYQVLDNGTRLVVAESVSAPWQSIFNAIVWDNTVPEDLYKEYLQGNLYVLHGDSASELELKVISLGNEYLISPPIKAKLAMPIINNNQLWGLICIHQYDSSRHWQEWEIDLMKQLSSQFTIIFQQATLYQQVQIELASKEILYQQLENELQQKKVLLKEVHHRVKNNLQVMSSLLRMQFRKTPPEVKILVEEYQNRIQSMALLHAQLHRNDDLDQINFYNYISDLLVNLFQCYGKSPTLITYTIDASNISLPLDRSISLGLIINELISNSLKYAFPKGIGKINIQLLQKQQQYHLIVADNGIGIPANIILEHTDSLGMQLVFSLAEQLEGTLIHNGEEGTKFQLIFPVWKKTR
ncbi:PAS domain-containing protein [Pseudanabaena sp. UWO310]|uniref:PAS domain-containing protein n=1 Tax=Pseudanabaena sp. UWO310 TaxID=2480795 RepID=UPI001158F61E|nr:PAS domain-containing protein [Pseudanabaena sp. UWO310]TYQ31224.1 PAS domain-containing protein [Pseudanabaena sp. UWO310]